MNLVPTAEQEAIRDSVRRLLADRVSTTRLREAMRQDTPAVAGLWEEAGALGWFGLHLPETMGGSGYGVSEAMLLFVELGRSLAPGPWLGTVVAARALADHGERSTLAALLEGKLVAAVADDPADVLGADERLEGTVPGVLDLGAAAAVLVLGARRAAWLEVSAPGVAARVAPAMDPTRRLGRLECNGARARVLNTDARRLRRVATVLAAAETLGVAERALEASVEYAKVRQQFGRPIGAFQAIKHRCSDMATRTECARASVTWAAVALEEDAADAVEWVAVAKVLASRAALENTHDNIQNHGGMGYTWESDAHLLLKRAHLLEHCFGNRLAHLASIAAPWRNPD